MEKHVYSIGMHSDGYDVCLSFAGEDRPYVERVANALRLADIRVFYDAYEEAELWGRDLYQHLSAVYAEARYCVIFISSAYARKIWPKHELRSAQARALNERRAYILPARFDDTELPGLPPTVAYIDLRHRTPDEFAAIVVKKLGGERQNQAGQSIPPYERRDGDMLSAMTVVARMARWSHEWARRGRPLALMAGVASLTVYLWIALSRDTQPTANAIKSTSPQTHETQQIQTDESLNTWQTGVARISTEVEFERLKASPDATIIVFCANWAVPCAQFIPELSSVLKPYAHVRMFTIDTDELRGIAKQYAVSAVPEIIVFRAGSLRDRHSGALYGRDLVEFVSRAAGD